MEKIKVENVRKTYVERRTRSRIPNDSNGNIFKPIDILSGIEFTVMEKEFVSILGPSGCGKSTILNIISGFEEATAGAVYVDGKTVNGPLKNAVFIFQDNGLFPWLTVKENIAIGLRNQKDRDKVHKKIFELIDMIGLKRFENHYPHQLSGGMKQRVELARAIAVNSEILFMDEPFSALDFLTRLNMREELVNLMQIFPMTTVMITHDIDEALQVSDKVIVLTDRPTKVRKVFELPSSQKDFAHPRDFSRGMLEEVRKEVYFQMGVHIEI